MLFARQLVHLLLVVLRPLMRPTPRILLKRLYFLLGIGLFAVSSSLQASSWDEQITLWSNEWSSIRSEDLPLLVARAEQGDARSLYLLWRESSFERFGFDTSREAQLLGSFVLKQANKNDPVAMFLLCNMLTNGKNGIPQNQTSALEWCQKSGGKGLGEALWQVGSMLDTGKGVEKDPISAMRWYRKAADAGSTSAMITLGWKYRKGEGVSKDIPAALEWFQKAALAGRAEGMTDLGFLYLDQQNVSEAMRWFTKGAEAGESFSMRMLGGRYLRGYGVRKDPNEAVKWLTKCADPNASYVSEKCSYDLGWVYHDGGHAGEGGIKQDFAKAIEFFRQSASEGKAEAKIALAHMYFSGLGVSKDERLALVWYREGIEGGGAGGAYQVARRYMYGYGVRKNYNEAARWFSRSLQAPEEFERKTSREKLSDIIAKDQITDSAVRQEVAAAFTPAPKAEWATLPSSTHTENTEIILRLADAGGGIGDIQLFIDGAIVDRNASRDFGVEAAKDMTRRSFTVKLPEGRHTIKIRAYAAENMGNFTELSGSITSTWKKFTKPKLHLIAVGVNEFVESGLNLKYAQADARAVYESLIKQIGGIYDKGETRLLLGRESAGKHAIINAIRTVQQNSQFDDVFVFYAASHGKNYESGGYYLLTSDVAARAADKVKQASLSYIELRDLFSQVKSRKKFVLLDTCHAGQSIKADDLVGTRGGLKDDEQDLIDSLKQRSGATVLMASELEQKAFEGYKGHGLFTYALLEAIGAAPANNSKLGNVRSTDEIMMHVESRVPQLAKEIFKAEQKTYASKAGAGFPLVKLSNP